jgi:hypothetical protein
MIDEAIALMPRALRLALVRHRDQVVRGAVEPLTGEEEAGHLPAASAGTLEESVADAALGLSQSVEGARPFREVAYRFGVLAHYVADAGFPAGVGSEEAGRHYAHFANFCESRRARFPLVFYGNDDPALARDDFHAFAESVIARARGDADLLAKAYGSAGDPPVPSAFDDRSVPFAVASLSYSRTVTDIVRAWLRAWSDAHGDVEGAPYPGTAP